MFYFCLEEGTHPRTGCRRDCAAAKFTRFDLRPTGTTGHRVELAATCRACGGDIAWLGDLLPAPIPGRWSVELPRVAAPRLGAALHPRKR